MMNEIIIILGAVLVMIVW